MLKITIHDSAAECRFRLEGRLTGPWVTELEMSWQTAASTTSGRRTAADLREEEFVDDAGRALLERMHEAGVRLTADTPVMKDLLREITGHTPAAESRPGTKLRAGVHKLISRTCTVLAVLLSTGLASGALR